MTRVNTLRYAHLPAPAAERLAQLAAAAQAAPQRVVLSGPRGAGKSSAARELADASGAPLYRVDLAGVVSRYLGETETHLDRVFAEAEGAGAVLLLEDADALFGRGSESDAGDARAPVELERLIQRIAAYRGRAVVVELNDEPGGESPAAARVGPMIRLPPRRGGHRRA